MLNYKNVEKIEVYLKKTFPIIYDFEFGGQVFLIGGAITNIIDDKIPRDLDFVILNNDNNILDFIKKYNLHYKLNHFNGYKIEYNNISIDIWQVNDLYKAIEYNLDGIFYNLNHKFLIPFGYVDGIERNELIKLNKYNVGTKISESRRYKNFLKILKKKK